MLPAAESTVRRETCVNLPCPSEGVRIIRDRTGSHRRCIARSSAKVRNKKGALP
jgi:hypothetical protein